ncbi:ATP-binding protein [Pedobacter hartonius]|uniref:Uncharacterized protein n=1 Tax=Pedobacter hartonius TaxID=425514 RepID=A0A1H3W4W5_9SPHI|nr:tetratricopeptide repeat-containing sensor histidine kinase [Pedobacter hartonius]SDZ81464.1 hypothetical protein SAMN05443550_10176 [Pedobacter hartonius]
MKYLGLLLFIIIFLSCRNESRKDQKENNLFYDQAFVYRERDMTDSAFYFFNRAKNLFLSQKDSTGVAKCLVNMGFIALDKGDNFGALEMSLSANHYFDPGNESQYVYINSNYNNLGMASQNLQDYKRAIKFYDQAIEFSRDSPHLLVNQNNKATVYTLLKSYKAALILYNSILKATDSSDKNYARALTNVAHTKWLQNPGYNAIPEYLQALRIRKEQKDLWGQNSSYAHLSEYYAKKSTDSALFYAKLRYTIAMELRSPDDQLGTLKSLIRFSPTEDTKKYFERYQYLGDSLQTERWKSKNQFAMVRYETEKHRADFLRAQAENVQKKNRLLIGYFIVVILLLVLLSVFLWFRKRNRILRQEKELEVKNTELRYVKKIHDRVANKVYHLMSEVENNPGLHRNAIADKLEKLYDISRDISYDGKGDYNDGNYAAELSLMIQSYSSEMTEVLIVGNDNELWLDVDDEAKTELFVVMQELMTNMDKHSKAQSVLVKFLRQDSTIKVSYSDNGVGMKDAISKNGVKNTENRIKNIRGTITFESILEQGLEINISFPVS